MGKKQKNGTAVWSGVVVSCLDGRFIGQVAQWMERRSRKQGGAYDLVTTIGGAAEVAELREKPELWEKLALAIEEHQVRTVYLAVHVDCLGLRRRFQWAEEPLKHEGYLELLQQATQAIQEEWPEVKVRWLGIGQRRCRRLRPSP